MDGSWWRTDSLGWSLASSDTHTLHKHKHPKDTQPQAPTYTYPKQYKMPNLLLKNCSWLFSCFCFFFKQYVTWSSTSYRIAREPKQWEWAVLFWDGISYSPSGTWYVVKDDLELLNLLPPFPECRDYRFVPGHSASSPERGVQSEGWCFLTSKRQSKSNPGSVKWQKDRHRLGKRSKHSEINLYIYGNWLSKASQDHSARENSLQTYRFNSGGYLRPSYHAQINSKWAVVLNRHWNPPREHKSRPEGAGVYLRLLRYKTKEYDTNSKRRKKTVGLGNENPYAELKRRYRDRACFSRGRGRRIAVSSRTTRAT